MSWRNCAAAAIDMMVKSGQLVMSAVFADGWRRQAKCKEKVVVPNSGHSRQAKS
jgi:hypothetical protein